MQSLKKQALGARISRELDKIGPNLRKIMGNMGWLFVDRFVRMGMGLFVGVWVARYLGPVQFGRPELRACVYRIVCDRNHAWP
jgi:hypothetical protein